MISKTTWDKWHVLEKDRITITDRDKKCVYCPAVFNSDSPKLKETVEHIDNETWKKNPPLVTDIAICCASCNRSKGAKRLLEWFDSRYCKKNNISKETVAPAIKDWIKCNS